MATQFGASNVLTTYESSLVFSIDPANPSCFTGPPTSNQVGTGMGVYNNQPSHVTISLNYTSPLRTFKGAPVYEQILTPTTSTGVSYLTGANNPGIGVVHGGGGGPANTYTGHSIFFKPLFPLAATAIYTHYSNIGGWQSSGTYEYIGDGWYRAYTTWFNTTAGSDGKYWAINPASSTLNQPMVCYWAGPFKEQQPQNSINPNSSPRAVNPYVLNTRSSSPTGHQGLTDGFSGPTDSSYYHGGILDLSGRGNGMSIGGTILYDEDGGGSLVFNGSNTYCITLGNAIPANSDYFTLEAWAKSSTVTGYQTVIGTEGTLRQIGFVNNTVTYGGNGGSGNILRTTFTSSVVANTWYHLCLVWDGQLAYCYVDGVLRDTNTIGALSGYTNPGRSMLGSYSTGGGELLNGKIGIARIYDRTLTASEVLNNYNATRSRYAK